MTSRIEEQIRHYILTVDAIAPPVEQLLPKGLADQLDIEPPVVEITLPPRSYEPKTRVPGWVMGVAAAALVLVVALPLLLWLKDPSEVVVAIAPPTAETSVPMVGTPVFVENPVNGHYYEAVFPNNGITWEEARVAAEGRSFLGVPGHLASITSEQESQFFSETFSSFLAAGPWIGGFQSEGAAEPDGGWQWVTGEPFDYDNWGEVEPNDDGGGENCIQVFEGAPLSWNDFPCAAGSDVVFIVEYDTPLGSSTNYNVDVSASFETNRLGDPAEVRIEGHGNADADWPSSLEFFIDVRTDDGAYGCSYTNEIQPFNDDGGALRVAFEGTSDCGTDWQLTLVVEHQAQPIDESSNESGVRRDLRGRQDIAANMQLQILELNDGWERIIDVDSANLVFYRAVVERVSSS